jgi:hypothetical protein
MAYIQCPDCGKKALSIATRCPHCARIFENYLRQSPETVLRRPRIPGSLIIAGVLTAIVVVTGAQREVRVTAGMSPAPASARTSEPAPRRPPRPAAVAIRPKETVPPAELGAAAPDSATPAPATADTVTAPPPAADSVLAAALVPAPPMADDSTEPRLASTWVNVRAGRSGSAPVVRILEPGDTVLVDSLRRGWYRAVSDGQTLGYVDRSLVRASPRAASN